MARGTTPQDSATTLRLPHGLRADAAIKASQQGVSLSELVRGALRRELTQVSN
ncbi:YlcI/YnfO family protein [Sphingomonas glacialis]|uniref:YlcI/YnfO family protein n=1 Tax=Sphingomonas glacialis TaxID=658225 RepID=UPI001672CC7B|nr:YlcI/YnfO family protein [Sphingomonas glacialis]